MEGKSSRLPEVTIDPAARPLAGDGTVDAAKAGKEPISPGTPSSAGKERRAVDAVPPWADLPLCPESASDKNESARRIASSRDQQKPPLRRLRLPPSRRSPETNKRKGRRGLPAKMEDADVSRQLKQMTDFIRQEAVEKAVEIEAAAAEEFQIEKLQLMEAEKKKIRQEYDRKEKQVGIKKKIDYSMQLNASRIKVLQAQDDLVTDMLESARKELLCISRDHQTYKKLLKILIVQSLLRLKEPAVLLRCRKEDLELVDSVLESAKNEYADKANVYPPEIVVDRHICLPSAPSHYQAPGPSCSGGVVLASRDGKIVCENTLDARLQVVFRKKLPEIRQSLFGQVAA